MKHLILIFLIVISNLTFACKCNPLLPISKNLCDTYNVIFYGMVDSIAESSEKGFNTAFFTIKELYKGNVQQQIKINYNATSSCMMSFSKNEEWLIYAKYKMFDHLRVSICDHNRKYFNESSQDFYQLTAQRTFNEEIAFLKSTLGIQPFAKANVLNEQREQFKPHNIQPEPINKLGLVLVSVVSMVIIIFLTRNKNKS